MKKLFLYVLLFGMCSLVVKAQDSPQRGQALYKQMCASCHGEALEGRNGPPLTGSDFASAWPTADLSSKIKNTMPQDNPGKLSGQQTADLVAYIQQAGKSAAPSAPQPKPVASGSAPVFPPAGNLQQLMRGILFPNSNVIFTVQTHNPGEKKPSGATSDPGGFNWTMWGSDIYQGWELVDYASLALAESAPLLLTPGRRCENGKPVPIDDPDWVKFTRELADVGKAAYKASQSRDQEKVSDISGDVADACMHCHQVFRDKVGRGRNSLDQSIKAFRCTKN